MFSIFGRGQHGFYDALGRPTDVVHDPNSVNVQSIHYGYDNVGNRIGMRTEINDVVQSYVTYEHDDLNRITGVFDHDSVLVTWNPDEWLKDGTVDPTEMQYNPLGQMTSISRPNDVTTTYSYGDITAIADIGTGRTENPYQVYEIDHSHDVDGLISQYGYEYDAVGNRSGMTISTPGGINDVDIDYSYDRANRMISETYNLIGNAQSTTTYQYDRAGNRTQMRHGDDITRYTYNDNDELTRVELPDYYYEDYTYDDRGNLEEVKSYGHGNATFSHYDYNARDQFISYGTSIDGVNINNVATYGYDYLGNRVEQNIGGTVTHYLWDEFSRWKDVILETDPNNATNITSYTLASGMLISQTNNGNVDYFLQDAQGSTVGIADNTGTVTSTYSYNAFGELDDNSTLETNYLYTGQQYDPTTELYSLRARYYDPMQGRFLTRDTWAYDYQNPFELNRYAYGANNPATFTDPSGHFVILMMYSMNTDMSVGASLAVMPLGALVVDLLISVAFVVYFANTLSLVYSHCSSYSCIPNFDDFLELIPDTMRLEVARQIVKMLMQYNHTTPSNEANNTTSSTNNSSANDGDMPSAVGGGFSNGSEIDIPELGGIPLDVDIPELGGIPLDVDIPELGGFSLGNDIDLPSVYASIPYHNDGNVRLAEGAQGKHVIGHNNYIPGRSIFTGDAQELLNDYAGTGNNLSTTPIGTPGTKETVDFGQTIGTWIDRNSSAQALTSIGIIHYSKRGGHIVPSDPANPPR